MRKQVVFHMLADYEAAFLNQVHDAGGCIIRCEAPHGRAEPVSVLPEPGSERFWLSPWIAPRSMLDDLVIQEACAGQFFVAEESPVVQFARCELEPSGLTSGRIWAQMDVLVRLGSAEQYALVRKDPAFEGFYDRLARWLRRTYKRDTATGSYVGPAAQRWRDGGGRLLP